MSLAERRGGNRSVTPDTSLREAEMRNAGTATGTALATDIVEKDKPLLTVAR
jgi:hypothetical protein